MVLKIISINKYFLQADYASPLVFDDSLLIGFLILTNRDCTKKESLTLYTNVLAYQDFIKTVIINDNIEHFVNEKIVSKYF